MFISNWTFFAQTQNKKNLDVVPILKFNVNFQIDPSFLSTFFVPIKFLQRVFFFFKIFFRKIIKLN
jgi:hypothetical protein